MKIKLFLLHCALISISHAGWSFSSKDKSNYRKNPFDFNHNEEASSILEPDPTTADQSDDYPISSYDDKDVEAIVPPFGDYAEPVDNMIESDNDEFDYATTQFPSIGSDFDISLEEAETRIAQADRDIIRLERLVFIMQSSPDGILRTNQFSASTAEFLQQQDIPNYEELSVRAESEVENSLDNIESLQDRVDDVIKNLKQDIELDEQDSDNRRDLLLKYKRAASKLEDLFDRVQVLADTKDSLEAESIDSNDPALSLFSSTNNLFPDNDSKLKNGSTYLGTEEDVVEDDEDMPDVNLSLIYSQYANGNSEDSVKNSTENFNFDDESFDENALLEWMAMENITTEEFPADLFKQIDRRESDNSTGNNTTSLGVFLNLVDKDSVPFNTNRNLSDNLNDTFYIDGNKQIIKDSNEKYNTKNPTYNYEDEEYNTENSTYNYEDEEYNTENSTYNYGDEEYNIKNSTYNYEDEEYNTENSTYNYEDEEYKIKNPTFDYKDEEYGSENKENSDDETKDDANDNELLGVFSNTKDSDQHEGVTNLPAPFEFQGQKINEDFERKFKEILPNYFDSEELNPETEENAFKLITEISENTSPEEESVNEELETFDFNPNMDYTLVNNEIEESIDRNPLLTNQESSNVGSTETNSESLDKNQSDLNAEGNDVIADRKDKGIFNGQSAQVQLTFKNFIAKMNSSVNEKEEIEAEEGKLLKEIIKNENKEEEMDSEDNESNPILKAQGLSIVQLALIISAAAIPMLLVIALLVLMSMRRWNKKKVPYKVMDDDEVFDKKIIPPESGSDEYSINV